MTPWKTLSQHYVLKSHWLNLRADRCEIAPGKIIEPFYVIETMDWVHIVALDKNGQIFLVRQFRYAGQCVSEELPGGLLDAGEDPLDTAKRELLEEVGATAERWTHLASTRPDPARMNNHVHTFLAEGVEVVREQELDDSEDIVAHRAPLASVPGLIASGDFAQSTQIASYFMALHHLEGRKKTGPQP